MRRRQPMRDAILWVLAVVLIVSWTALPALAYNCPVQIRQAEELIKRAEGTKPTGEALALLEEAKKFLAAAKAHHEQAKTKKDHADAVRKAKFAQALAEEVLFLQSP